MTAMQVMSALSQSTRLDVFTRLAAASPEGMSAGELATATKAAASVMSAHLAILSRAGLVRSTKKGRTVNYRASFASLSGLVAFLNAIGRADDGGRSESGDENDADTEG